MQVATHQFREAFLSGNGCGWVVEIEADRKQSGLPSPVRQKFDNHHLCLFVFETEIAAKEEEKNFGAKIATRVSRVQHGEIQDFIHRTFGVSSTLVFLKDATGKFALL